MSWGVGYMYYHCPRCGKKFKYALDLIAEFGDSYGQCPDCKVMGVYERDGAIGPDDAEYADIE